MDTLNVQSSTADNLGTRREYLGSRYTFLLSATVPLLHVIAPRNWTSHLLRLLVWISYDNVFRGQPIPQSGSEEDSANDSIPLNRDSGYSTYASAPGGRISLHELISLVNVCGLSIAFGDPAHDSGLILFSLSFTTLLHWESKRKKQGSIKNVQLPGT